MAADFRILQEGMTNWLRRPELAPAPDLEPRRLAIYRELVFNNLADFIGHTFPVLRSLLPEARWLALLNGFLAGHHAQSPYFRDIAAAFREWLETQESFLADYPWARELAHFEWVQSAAEADPVEEPALEAVLTLPESDWPQAVPCLRAALWPLIYRWPVHELGPASVPAAEPPVQPTALLLYRDDDGELGQLVVSPLAARLVECWKEQPELSLGELMAVLVADTAWSVTDLLTACRPLLADLLARGVLYGWRAI